VVVAWWVDVVIMVIVGNKTKEPLNVDRFYFEKLLAGESGSVDVTGGSAFV